MTYNDNVQVEDSIPDNIVIYDGLCVLCNHAVRFIIRHDSAMRFKFASLQSHIAEKALQRCEDINTNRTIILLHKGTCFIKSGAVLKIAQQLDLPYRFFYAFVFLPRIIRDIPYDFIARIRYRLLGTKLSCPVPEPSIRNRFLV